VSYFLGGLDLQKKVGREEGGGGGHSIARHLVLVLIEHGVTEIC